MSRARHHPEDQNADLLHHDGKCKTPAIEWMDRVMPQPLREVAQARVHGRRFWDRKVEINRLFKATVQRCSPSGGGSESRNILSDHVQQRGL